MVFHIITLFPEMIRNYLEFGILSRAQKQNTIVLDVIDLRKAAVDKYGHVDEGVFGPGKGMLFRPEPLDQVLTEIKNKKPGARVIYLTPQGKRFTNKDARRLSQEQDLVFIAARYEGIDSRIVDLWVDEEISIGDYVLTGGELPALVLLDSIARFIDGSIKKESADEDSFENGLLEYDHYTEPLVFKGLEVPEVLRAGNHKDVEQYRLFSSLRKTFLNRPDLIRDYQLETDAGMTENRVKILKRKNDQLSSYLKAIQIISKEWKHGRRNSD